LRFNCRKWYIVAIQQFQEKFNFCDPIFQIVEILDPNNARLLSLSLPFSNAVADRKFSVVNKVKTAMRNHLHNVTLTSLIVARKWLKNQKATASSVDNLISTERGRMGFSGGR
jgi:hypothetical protein